MKFDNYYSFWKVSIETLEFNQRMSTDSTLKKQADSLIWRYLGKIRTIVQTEKSTFFT